MGTMLLIGEFEIEPATRRLRRPDGEPTHLANRPFQVLLHLVANRDRLVTRAELLEHFWDGRDVYDDALTRCMSTVRKALDDYGSPARFVETRWAEGYRFVGPCVEFEDGVRSARASAPTVERAQGARHRPAFSESRDTTGAGRLVERGNAYLGRSGHRSYRYALEMFRLAVAEGSGRRAGPWRHRSRARAAVPACGALRCASHRGWRRRFGPRSSSIPVCADVQHARAQVAVMRDDYAEAYRAFREAESLAPDAVPHLVLPRARACRARRSRGRARPVTCAPRKRIQATTRRSRSQNSRSSTSACMTTRGARR